MNRMQKLFAGLGVGLTLAAGAVNTASALDVPFDPDGPGPIDAVGSFGTGPLPLLSGLDWGVGNALAVDSVPLTVGAEFTVHYQARLVAFQTEGGGTTVNFNQAGGGLATYRSLDTSEPLANQLEWTVNARFRERVVAIVGTTAFFEVVDDPATNYLKIFYDATPDSSSATGTGFINGQEILSASIVVGSNSAFTVTGLGTIDNTPGGDPSVLGSGSFNITALVDTWDEDFLGLSAIGILPGEFKTTLITSTLELPIDPGVQAALLEQVGGPNVVPNYGATNGESGPDFLFEADGNQVFNKINLAIPEPATAMLGLMGLAGLAIRRSRREA